MSSRTEQNTDRMFCHSILDIHLARMVAQDNYNLIKIH